MPDLPNRPKTEEEFARAMSRMMASQRQELIRLLGNPPDMRRVPDEFWQRVQQQAEDELSAILIVIMMQQARITLGMIPDKPTLDRDVAIRRIDTTARVIADHRSSQMAESYVETSRQQLEQAQQRWDAAIDAGEEISDADIHDTATNIFGPTRSENIAITETTNAASQGGEITVRATVGESDNDTWFTEADGRVCPFCAPLHQASRTRWERFYPDGPPAHPRCRCWIQYAFELVPLASGPAGSGTGVTGPAGPGARSGAGVP